VHDYEVGNYCEKNKTSNVLLSASKPDKKWASTGNFSKRETDRFYT
jgi:hypothetical protein